MSESRPVCGCCGTETVPPTPGSKEEGFYCEGCGIAWDDPTQMEPSSCLLHRGKGDR